RVLLTGGVHGDETSGVEAILSFLESMAGDAPGAIEITAVPCVNPWGYEAATRSNADGVDVNRAFEEDEVAEARVLKAFLRGRHFEVHVDFHEDFEGRGFYLYEGRRGGPWLGPQVIAAVEQVSPIEPEHADEGPLYRGGYEMAQAWGTRGLCVYVLAHCAPHCFTFEAAMPQPLETRVAAHRAGLEAVVAHYRQGRGLGTN
ncbi:MAG: M14 family metallocarboxypeptidase, partial [Gemmatimonadota bacterium]